MASAAPSASTASAPTSSSAALAVVGDFSPSAVSALLSEQMREAVVSTASLAVGE